MGVAVCGAVEAAPDLDLVVALDVDDDLAAVAASGATVAIDFTVPSATEANVQALIDSGVHAVVGTSGWDEVAFGRVRDRLAGAPGVGVLIAPNFALGAVLAMAFAAQAARWFESAEVVELHHPDKVDAPSGTSRHTAAARSHWARPPCRGGAARRPPRTRTSAPPVPRRPSPARRRRRARPRAGRVPGRRRPRPIPRCRPPRARRSRSGPARSPRSRTGP